MKKLFTLAIAALTAGAAFAQDPEDLRIYINPGHGSWTGNDRPMQVIGKKAYVSEGTDTTSFFESNTDLIKGFGVLETLINMGFPFDRTLNQDGEDWLIGAAKDLSQNLVMSRVKNGPYDAKNVKPSSRASDPERYDYFERYNRALFDIAAEVEYNDFDMFISIHSNAASSNSTNYHLFMYRGKNGIQNVAVQGSWEMIEAAAKYSFPNKHAAWSHSNVYINGDVDFMGSGSGSTNSLGYYGYLGVMKHGCPGYLVEGYFHTYLPSTHRGMNFDVDFEEGAAYARGVAEYFGFERDQTGDLYGIVRDMHEKFSHALYVPRSGTNDIYKPLNGAKAVLYKDGEKIDEYTTDNFYNGAFVFFGLEPGTYTVQCEAEGYKIGEPQEVEVVAGDCVYPCLWLESEDWVTDADMQASYPDQLGATDRHPYGATDNFVFEKVYEGKQVTGLKGTVQRSVVKGDRLYVMSFDESDKSSYISVFDAKNGAHLTTVSTAGAVGNQQNIGDIAVTADGYLVACNKEKVYYSADYLQDGDTDLGKLRIYYWKNDNEGVPTGDPILKYEGHDYGDWYRSFSGSSMTWQGTLEDGAATLAMPSTYGPNYTLRTTELSFIGGNGSPTIHRPQTTTGGNLTSVDMGQYRLVLSPLNERNVWIMTEKQGIIEISNNTLETATPCNGVSGTALPANVLNATPFKYCGHTYLTITHDGALRLFDVTDGIAKAKEVTIGDHAHGIADGAHGWVSVKRNAETNAIATASVDLYTVSAGQVARYTTDGVTQALDAAPYAHSMWLGGEGAYELNFAMPANATSARAILTPVDGGDDIVIEGAKPGMVVDNSLLDPAKTYNWAIEMEGANIHSAGLIFKSENQTKACRGGVQWIKDSESPNFGKIIVANSYAQGIDVYNPDFTKVGSYMPEGNRWANKLTSPNRVGQNAGIAYICDGSDPGAGYWAFDASAPETTYDALGGTLDNTGAHSVDGSIIGGGATSVAFNGTGEDTRMYSFVEDYPTGNSKYVLCGYHVGTDKIWSKAPEKVYSDVTGETSGLMSGQDVEVVTTPKGMFVSQYRAEGNNKKEAPAFIFMDYNGSILFNSASLDDELTSCGGAVAISEDLSTMAISERQNGIGIWQLEWNGNVPALTKMYIIPGSEGANYVNQMQFDTAGNLYAYHRTESKVAFDGNLRVYTLRNAAPVSLVKAPATSLISGDPSGIGSISVDNPAAGMTPVYYNLNGVRVNGTPAPGLYIKVVGGKATKELVK